MNRGSSKDAQINLSRGECECEGRSNSETMQRRMHKSSSKLRGFQETWRKGQTVHPSDEE